MNSPRKQKYGLDDPSKFFPAQKFINRGSDQGTYY